MTRKATTSLRIALSVNMASVLMTLAIFFALFQWGQTGQSDAVIAPADRLAHWAALSLWPALLLMGQVGAVMAARAGSRAFNPIADGESPRYRVAQRVLSNSVEQTLIFLPVLASWCVLAPASAYAMAVPATALFITGRALFWIGYLIHPYARAPGMAMTWTVSLVLGIGGLIFTLTGS